MTKEQFIQKWKLCGPEMGRDLDDLLARDHKKYRKIISAAQAGPQMVAIIPGAVARQGWRSQ